MQTDRAFNEFNKSSNINEVIKAVLNFFFFFNEKIQHAQKALKNTNTKSTKRHKDTRAKAQKRK